ncbi:MAG: RNA methyltransferase [Armatimonadota bacterium]|nr:RNA methyltransferase [Armatimonadota bacterium]
MITSTRHPLVQTLRRLARRPALDRTRVLLEGPRVVAEALAAGLVIEAALVDADGDPALAALADRLRAGGARVHPAARRVVQAAGSVVTSQGVVALAARPPAPAASLLDTPDLVVLVADGIADPGNLGAMVRTALAAGATALAACGGADPFHPKVVRAAAGAAFRLPILHDSADALRERLVARGARIVVADPRAAVDYTAARLEPPVAVVVGNEARGPSPAWAAAGLAVRIPHYGPVESLNAAAAAAVLLYEVARRRASVPR